MAEGDINYGKLNNIQLDVETIEGIKSALATAGIDGGIDYMSLNNILIEVDTIAGKKKAIAVANLSSTGDIPTDPEFNSLKVGDVSGGNYYDIEQDGTWVSKGDATMWDEISQSFVGRNIYAVAGRVDYNYIDLTLDFNTNARYPDEPAGIVTQIMHARRTDSDIRPHIHWMQNSNNNPNILIEYRMYNINEVPPAWTLKALTTADNKFTFTTVGQQQLTEFNLPVGHGIGLGLSFTIDVKIYRDSQNTSGLFGSADSYSGIWSAKYYDIHVERDMNGSHEEFVK